MVKIYSKSILKYFFKYFNNYSDYFNTMNPYSLVLLTILIFVDKKFRFCLNLNLILLFINNKYFRCDNCHVLIILKLSYSK
jgi:hypothetical protein